MSYLEKLTLYLRVQDRDTFIGSTNLENEIFVYMPQLHSFTFYIFTYHNTVDLFNYVPSQDNQRIVTNIRQQPMTSSINYISSRAALCHIFSLPFVFDRREDIGNIFSDTVFNYVTFKTYFPHEVLDKIIKGNLSVEDIDVVSQNAVAKANNLENQTGYLRH
ncbi:unnamed protein product [Rotaria sp. Silwood2]|nr:unnamed protein product [Rotaria sp. Silwood2]